MRAMLKKAAAAALLVLGACSGNPRGEGPGGEYLRVVVQNDGTIPTQVRVYLVPGSGAEIQLGSLSTLGTQTLTTREPMIQGTYRLIARGGTDYQLISPPVQLRGDETITWDMRRNVIRLGGDGE